MSTDGCGQTSQLDNSALAGMPDESSASSRSPTSEPYHPTSSHHATKHPPTYAHPPEHSTPQNYSIAEQAMDHIEPQFHPSSHIPAPATNVPCPLQSPYLSWPSCPPGPYFPPHPATHLDHPTMFDAIHSLPDFQSSSTLQSSTTITRPEDSIDHVHQRPPWNLEGPVTSLSSRPQHSHQPHYQNQGMFSGSHYLSFKDSIFIDNSTTSENFMKDFLQHTIIGAEYDSSDRDPPPRCHPGTRLAIVGRCKAFVVECNGKEKMRWVVGAAGVGKSAIMQMVAEETPADASVFLSVNGRQDGTKVFTTVAYQLAAKYKSYRQFIQSEIISDPSLLRKQLQVQFNKFIIEPFINQNLFNHSRRFVIVIDGLDECDNPLTQLQLLGLISGFCISYPTSPVVWFIASRPEPHLTSFFAKHNVRLAHAKEEISVDSNEACKDVQRYLRDELNEIKLAYPTLEYKREWPSELQFTKIATAAGGLFAYASTVVRYINDPYYGDPASQLSDVIVAIDGGLNGDTPRNNNPLALLDALYARIISKIPDGAVINARKILLLHSKSENQRLRKFRTQCNRLGLTEDAAYGAVRHLHAVVKVPAPDKADNEGLTFHHKSFEDFLFDPLRSTFLCNDGGGVGLLKAQCSLRILEQVPANFDRMALGESIKCYVYGYLKAGPSLCDNISLSWPGDERFSITDHELRRKLYAVSMDDICSGFRDDNNLLWTMICFQSLTTRFTMLRSIFPVRAVRDSVFDKFRSELIDLGKLKQVPLRALHRFAICGSIDIRFAAPVGMDVKYSDLWDPESCKHVSLSTKNSQHGRWTSRFERSVDDPEESAGYIDTPWVNIEADKHPHQLSTLFSPLWQCLHCWRRFTRHFINNMDHLVTVFVDATALCYVEWSFVDPDDGLSEWRYRFCHSGAPKSIN